MFSTQQGKKMMVCLVQNFNSNTFFTKNAEKETSKEDNKPNDGYENSFSRQCLFFAFSSFAF
jgi:hypothetical protein